MIRKLVIPSTNKKALAFFEELNKKKAEIRKRLEERSAGIFPPFYTS